MFGLSVDTLRGIRGILTQFPRIEKVLIYGSRAKGNYKAGSDIDITLIGKGLTWKNTISPLIGKLDDLYLPYKFDISIFNQLEGDEFIAHILRVGKTFYEKKNEVMAEWKTIPLAQCIRRIDIPKKIPRKQFEDAGRFPIISQERDFINGYWSDESDVIHIDSPLVVFGDHTQVLKYIDFDFVVGADGVKLLHPNPFLDSKYFYYFLMGHPLGSLGYARHFRLVMELDVVFPEAIPEQKRIVAILDEAFATIETAAANIKKNLANARELFESQLERVFTSEVVVKGRAVPLVQCLQHIDIPKKIPRKQFDDVGRFPIISQERDFINGYWSDESDVIHIDSPLIVFGDHTQVLKYIDFDFVVGADGVKLLHPKPFLDPKYFYYFLMGHPVGSLGYARHFRLITKLDVVFPESIPVQKQIVATLDKASANFKALTKIGKQKLAHLADLKQSLLHQAFTGALTAESDKGYNPPKVL